MEFLNKISLENRKVRHGLFWALWILGFTFVKSFGAPLETYLGWLIYYLVTLPIFVLHTYLIVYWVGKKFIKGAWIMLFVFLFLVLMLFFSFIELILTDEFLSVLFPDLFFDTNSYLNPGNILISGIGNLYIILVFAAAKMMREWYITDHYKQDLVKRNLYLKRADANASVQPGMLLFSIEKIEEMELKKKKSVPEAIALLSELLNAVMQAQKNGMQRVDEEARNVKKMLKLYALLFQTNVPNIRIDGHDLAMKSLPVFILFSPLEILFRQCLSLPVDDIYVNIIDETSLEISWESECSSGKVGVLQSVREEMDTLYPDQFLLEAGKVDHTFSLAIRALRFEKLAEV